MKKNIIITLRAKHDNRISKDWQKMTQNEKKTSFCHQKQCFFTINCLKIAKIIFFLDKNCQIN